MSNKQPLKICSINLAEDVVDRLIKVLRTSGLPAQIASPTDGESLSQHLDKHIPDVMLVGGHGELDIAQVSSMCRKRIPKVPRLLVDTNANENRNDALKFQYDDLVDVNNESWLIHCINREWERYRSLCSIESLEIELQTLSTSHSQMVAASDKGIAYVCDGLHVTCTQRYAAMFEYPSESDICITPLIDLIAPKYQENFKKFLKDFSKSNSENSIDFETTCITAGGKPLPIKLEFTKSNYEGEDALRVAASQAAKANTDSTDQQAKDFVKQVEYLIETAKKDRKSGSIVCLQTWNFWKIRKKVGVLASNEVHNQYYSFLQKAAGSKITTSRIGAEFFAMALPGINASKAAAISTKLIENIEEHIFEVKGISLNCYTRAGIIEFDHKTKKPPEELINLGFEALSKIADEDSDDIVRVYKPESKPVSKAQGFDPTQTLSSLTQSGGLQFTFQPVVSLRDDPFELYEVRTTITDPNGIDVDLNKLAETKVAQNGESKLDRWVFGLAMARLAKQVVRAPKTRLLITLSPHVFNDKTFAPWVLEQCSKTKISRQQIIFQWAESDITERLKPATQFTSLLNKAKFVFSISEYDHSMDAAKTLALLKPKMIKMTDEIAAGANENKDYATKMETILGTASDIECAVIVPQVNSAPSLAWLWQSGAAFVQGDYIQAENANMEFDFSEMGM